MKLKRHLIIKLICVLSSIGAIAVLLISYVRTFHENQDSVEDLDARVLDKAIEITWSSPSPKSCDKLVVEILDGEVLVESVTLSPLKQKYVFRNGVHGTFYTIRVNDEQCYSMFLDYDQLPDLPIINIDTLDGNDPTYTEAQKPNEEYFGESIDNNFYVNANITISQDEETFLADSIKIKVRGNTSSVWMVKKSYKIKFDRPVDLLDEGADRSHNEWILLNSGVYLNTFIGNYIGDALNMEWNPHSTWANVIVNGDWKGCYYLTEPVDYESNPVGIEEDGYIFEGGAYFWKRNQKYFTLNNQSFGLGYSFVYPEIAEDTTTNNNEVDNNKVDNKTLNTKDVNNRDTTGGERLGTDEDLAFVHTKMQDLEDSLLSPESSSFSYDEIIDINSFAGWILARDILGNEDGGGTNMFFYMKTHDSKIQMGPLWDFDNLFMRSGDWSANHDESIFYFPQLLEKTDFLDSYEAQWRNIEENLVNDIAGELYNLNAQKGAALNESFILDETRWQLDGGHWPEHITLVEDQINEAIDWFMVRKVWMDYAVENLRKCIE